MNKSKTSKSDWTYNFFVKKPKLFLDSFKIRLTYSKSESKSLLRYLKSQDFKTNKILDLNCGVGRHSIELGKMDIKVIGTDISPFYIKIAANNARKARVDDKVKFYVADMRKAPSVLKNEKPFDGIVNLWTSFGYLNKTENDRILKRCLGLVSKGGFFVIEIVNKDWLMKNFQKRSFEKIRNTIVLHYTQFNSKNSRIYNVWTYLKRKNKSLYLVDGEIVFSHQIWNLDELVKTFKKAGWQFKAAYPGFGLEKSKTSAKTARRFLVIFQKGKN